MVRKRRRLDAKLKAKVALAAIRSDRTLSQLASQFGVHGNQVSAWKRKLISEAVALFEDGRNRHSRQAAPPPVGWLVATEGRKRTESKQESVYLIAKASRRSR